MVFIVRVVHPGGFAECLFARVVFEERGDGLDFTTGAGEPLEGDAAGATE